jgi:hypothetical protein
MPRPHNEIFRSDNDDDVSGYEYDSYIGGILDLFAAGASTDRLAAHLLDIERRIMGVPGDERRALRVAALLDALRAKVR